MENYEKKYKEALSFLKDLKPHMSDYCIEKLEGFFPELQKSEDERIRKELKSYFDSEISDYGNVEWRSGIYYGEIVAWLEKQDKQKSTDKVEPKFKVGDFIISKHNSDIVYKITGIGANESHEPEYVCEHVGRQEKYVGRIYNINQNKVDSNFETWTIQDAKDGDVLYAIGKYSDCMFIFNKLDICGSDNLLVATGHCCIDIDKNCDRVDFCVQGPDSIDIKNIVPTIKERRKFLFQKMKEAGYEWDDEKKELRKIEQKPTWSEEDEMMIKICREGIDMYFIQDDKEKVWNWLESLKNRIIPFN